ncbi:MAG: ATP-binding protein [Acidobacteria bacterium]|jgi:predicted ATPase|nr:MAG: ATP-binding protein [Acidobacteriota bacterium]GIU83213.1 MAG: ATPase [Pyrinomonadaceae bacterium]
MIHRIQVYSYKCLRYVDQSLGPFQILVGPNASGKSTFLDVFVFLPDLLKNGLERAVRKRARTLKELTWQMQSDNFEIAIEFGLPESLRKAIGYSLLRYEIQVGLENQSSLALLAENLWFCKEGSKKHHQDWQSKEFPRECLPPQQGIVIKPRKRTPSGYRKIMGRAAKGRLYIRSEKTNWNFPLHSSSDQAGLGLIPEEHRFPASSWLRKLILEKLNFLMLDSRVMRAPCPPDAPISFQADGSNFPIVVKRFREKNPKEFANWVAHVQTVLPEIKDIEVNERQEDRHLYLVACMKEKTRIPSWLLSDGTLRFLALTLLAYVENANESEESGIYIIEEPENGIHPKAIEAVYQSLSSIYKGQVFCATHSPILLNLAEPAELLCFARTQSGSTDIVRGDKHPALASWREEVTLGDLLASGVLG